MRGNPIAAAGVVAVIAGLVIVVERGVAGLVDLSYVVVTLVGVLALVLGLGYANRGRTASIRFHSTSEVETRYEVPTPGDDVDDLLATVDGFSRASIRRRRQFRDRLGEVARSVLVSRGDYAETAADRAVRKGTWTDDDTAAWFLGEDIEPPVRVRLRRVLGSTAPFRYAARRTIDALSAARTSDEPGDPATEAGDSEVGSNSTSETARSRAPHSPHVANHAERGRTIANDSSATAPDDGDPQREAGEESK